MKKIIIYAIILSIILTGCWDLTDPEKLGLVTLMGIDTSDDGQIKVLIHEMPYQKQSSGQQNGGSGGGASIKLHSAEAPTISEAIQKITASDFRRTYFPYANAIILSEELVSSKGITPLMDYLERTIEIRCSMWILIAKEGQFNKIFSTSPWVEPNADPGNVIKKIIENKTTNSFLTTNSLSDFFNLSWETGSEPYTSGIELIDITGDKANQGEGSNADKSNTYDLSVQNTAVFKKEKLAGWMDNEESMGLLWATDGIKGGIISVKFHDKDVALKIVKADSNIKPKIADGKLQIDIHVNVTTDINESQASADYERSEVINKIQDLQAREIEKQILAALSKSRSLNSDVFGFGNYFFGKYPNYWRQIGSNWYDYYRDIDVNIDISSKVNHIGLTRKNREGS